MTSAAGCSQQTSILAASLFSPEYRNRSTSTTFLAAGSSAPTRSPSSECTDTLQPTSPPTSSSSPPPPPSWCPPPTQNSMSNNTIDLTSESPPRSGLALPRGTQLFLDDNARAGPSNISRSTAGSGRNTRQTVQQRQRQRQIANSTPATGLGPSSRATNENDGFELTGMSEGARARAEAVQRQVEASRIWRRSECMWRSRFTSQVSSTDEFCRAPQQISSTLTMPNQSSQARRRKPLMATSSLSPHHKTTHRQMSESVTISVLDLIAELNPSVELQLQLTTPSTTQQGYLPWPSPLYAPATSTSPVRQPRGWTPLACSIGPHSHCCEFCATRDGSSPLALNLPAGNGTPTRGVASSRRCPRNTIRNTLSTGARTSLTQTTSPTPS